MWSLPEPRQQSSLTGAGERTLIAAAQGGSEPAVEELFRRHWPNTHRAAYLIVRDAAAARGIAQEAFLSALGALERFDRRRRFAPWLHRIAVNRAIDWSRGGDSAARSRRASRCSTRRASVAASPGRGRVERRARAGARPLSAEHRATVVLRYLLGYTPGEIARILDLPRGTVNSRLRRCAGGRSLSELLEEEES